MTDSPLEVEFVVGPSAIEAYSRLSYTMWYALAEFIDNSTQSRQNYGSIIDGVLAEEGQPLIVEIEHDRLNKKISISDNSIGMTKEKLMEALKIANPTKDSRGRSKYGMGMKTAACWIGKRWSVTTCEWGSGEEWTAEVDVQGIAREKKKIPLTRKVVSTDQHYTRLVISDLHRSIQKRTEETIRSYLGSMYRFDIRGERLRLLYNGIEVPPPEEYDFDKDPAGNIMRQELPEKAINGKTVRGWFAVLNRGGRKFGGFSLFQEERQIQGYPNAWKPKGIYGGVDDEGANNLVSQRLTGLLKLDGFSVSHTKDAILFEGDEEEELESFLCEQTKDYRDYATRRRRPETDQAWSREKVRDLVESMKQEFSSAELKDAITTTTLPPLETILKNNQQMVATLDGADTVMNVEVLPGLRLIVTFQQKSEYEPHLTISAGAQAGTIHVILNGLHPYYSSLEAVDAIHECIRQYIYDAIAEYQVGKQTGKVNPDSVRRFKDNLLRAVILRVENAAAAQQQRPESAANAAAAASSGAGATQAAD